MNHLQPYKGKSTRHTCPACETKQSFTLYIDSNTNNPIHPTVGKCNRESKCGYHYTTKQFFIDNPSDCRDVMLNVSNKSIHIPGSFTTPQPVGTIHFSYVEHSASYQSNFVRFLCEILTIEQITSIGENYALGATKTKEVIFWQIDINGKVRTGKIMQYNPETGKRIKHERGAIDWVHNKLKQTKQLPEDFNLEQCLFGEHLLNIYPEATVCIVESEKSALISAAILPEYIWLATGGIQGLTVDKCKVLKGRTIILYPDLNAFDKWALKAKEIQKQCNCTISVSNLLEETSTTYAKAQGLDVADFLINQLSYKNTEIPIESTPVQSRFTHELETMIETNPTLLPFNQQIRFN